MDCIQLTTWRRESFSSPPAAARPPPGHWQDLQTLCQALHEKERSDPQLQAILKPFHDDLEAVSPITMKIRNELA